MNGVRKMTLGQLNFNVINAFIVGVIIAKQRSKIFCKKVTQDQRAVWTFTLRDSPLDYINVTCWGKPEYIRGLEQTFQVGDVVNIIRPKICVRKIEDKSESFMPAVTSPFTLTVNEERSQIIIHDGNNYQDYLELLNYPTKPKTGILSLSDIQDNALKLKGEYVDLLVAVRCVGFRKTVNTKSGVDMDVREIIVMDQGHMGMTITLWESELIERAEQWIPRETILFIADVRVEIKKNITVIITGRTIITANPCIQESETLRKFAMSTLLQTNLPINNVQEQLPDVDSIRTIMSVARLREKIEGNFYDYEGPKGIRFTAVLYCFVTQLDLDGFLSLISTRCSHCNGIINGELEACLNLECPVGSGSEKGIPITGFDIPVTIADHTGSLTKIRLCGSSAESILGCSPDEFQNMTSERRCRLKWRYLLQRCETKVMVNRARSLVGDFKPPVVYLLCCVKADPVEVARKLPLY